MTSFLFTTKFFGLLDVHTLHELNEHLRRIVALNFPESIWIKGEIAQIDIAKGHCFIDLIEKNDEQLIARADAVIWERTLRKLYRQLGSQFQDIMQEGMEVMIKAQVDFNERYGYKLIIEDIDPSYTIGQLEIQKRATLQKLQAQNLIGRNRKLRLPLVIQNIAVLSSATAAGLKDFLHQLSENLYQYSFKTTVFESTLQGSNAPKEIIRSLKKINLSAQAYDCVAIIRGGGAKIDLNSFNDYDLCFQIANMSLPVIVGIGHETDETLTDLMAHTALKTPTAVAEYFIQHNEQFEGAILQMEQQLQWFMQQQLSQQQLKLQQLEEQLILPIQRKILKASQDLSYLEGNLFPLVKSQLKQANLELQQLERLNTLLDVQQTLARGYSITTLGKSIIQDSSQVKEGDHIVTQLATGQIESTIKNKS